MAEPQTNTPPAAPPPQQPVRVEGTRATPATNLYEGSPQARWQADQDARTVNDPWLDPNKVLTRDAAGNIVAHEKKLGPDGEAIIGKPLDQQPEGAEPPPVDGEAKHKFGDFELTENQIRDLAAHKAQEDLRRAQVPATPNGYKIELPKDLKLPNGAAFTLASPDDPIKGPGLRAAMDWAHKQGLSQSAFSEMLGVYAAATSSEQIMVANASKRERDAMGVTGPARVDAVLNWVQAKYPAAFKPVAATLATRAQVDMFEDIIMRFTNQGGGSFSGRGREASETQTISDEAWSKMSYHQQVEYAREATARAQSGRR